MSYGMVALCALGSTGCFSCSLLLGMAQSIGIGVTLLVSATGLGSPPECGDIPSLYSWAITYGALSLAVLPLLIFTLLRLTITVCCNRSSEVLQADGKSCFSIPNLVISALAIARFAVLIWGSVLAFSDSRLPKFQDGTLNCGDGLYKPAYICIIIEWVLAGMTCCNQHLERKAMPAPKNGLV